MSEFPDNVERLTVKEARKGVSWNCESVPASDFDRLREMYRASQSELAVTQKALESAVGDSQVFSKKDSASRYLAEAAASMEADRPAAKPACDDPGGKSGGAR